MCKKRRKPKTTNQEESCTFLLYMALLPTILGLFPFLIELQKDIQVFHFKCGKEIVHIPAAGF